MSTDGRASFSSFILNHVEGFRALQADDLLFFSAGGQDRSHLIRRPASSNLMTLRDTLNSFRIDGM